MNKVSAILSGKSLAVIINGEYHRFSDLQAENIMEMYGNALKVSQDPTDEKVDELRKFLDPSYRIAELDEIERDRNGNYYLKGTNVPMPALLITRIMEYNEQNIPIDNLMNFWKLAIVNPDPRAREGLFKFAETFGIPITSNGYFVTYKSVKAAGAANLDYVSSVSNMYLTTKATRKKKTELYMLSQIDGGLTPEYHYDMDVYDIIDSYVKNALASFVAQEDLDAFNTPIMDEVEMVLNTGEVKLFDIKVYVGESDQSEQFELDKYSFKVIYEAGKMTLILMRDSKSAIEDENLAHDTSIIIKGSLESQYGEILNLIDSDDESFTDFYTGKMDIRLGSPVEMDRKEVDNDPNSSCSYGLHVGSPEYVERFGYSSKRFILACLVNPKDVVAVPIDYEWQKMRVCKYFPYSVAEMEKGKIKELPSNYVEDDFIDYNKAELEKELASLESFNDGELSEEQIERIDILKRVITL